MYMVYWTLTDMQSERACSKAFASEEMREAMAFMEELSARQRSGEAIAFITMASENPNSVGLSGVADPSPDYAWKKRRP